MYSILRRIHRHCVVFESPALKLEKLADWERSSVQAVGVSHMTELRWSEQAQVLTSRAGSRLCLYRPELISLNIAKQAELSNKKPAHRRVLTSRSMKIYENVSANVRSIKG